MKQTIMGHDVCPCCNHELNAATDPMGKYIPNPGDMTICLYCQELLQYEDDMGLIKFPLDQYDKLPESLKLNIKMHQFEARVMAEAIEKGKEKTT